MGDRIQLILTMLKKQIIVAHVSENCNKIILNQNLVRQLNSQVTIPLLDVVCHLGNETLECY